MEPEGCSLGVLETARDQFGLSPQQIKRTLRDLWELRLLGWVDHDIEYLDRRSIGRLVSARRYRPLDTRDVMPVWFVSRKSDGTLSAYRFTKEA